MPVSLDKVESYSKGDLTSYSKCILACTGCQKIIAHTLHGISNTWPIKGQVKKFVNRKFNTVKHWFLNVSSGTESLMLSTSYIEEGRKNTTGNSDWGQQLSLQWPQRFVNCVMNDAKVVGYYCWGVSCSKSHDKFLHVVVPFAMPLRWPTWFWSSRE